MSSWRDGEGKGWEGTGGRGGAWGASRWISLRACARACTHLPERVRDDRIRKLLGDRHKANARIEEDAAEDAIGAIEPALARVHIERGVGRRPCLDTIPRFVVTHRLRHDTHDTYGDAVLPLGAAEHLDQLLQTFDVRDILVLAAGIQMQARGAGAGGEGEETRS